MSDLADTNLVIIRSMTQGGDESLLTSQFHGSNLVFGAFNNNFYFKFNRRCKYKLNVNKKIIYFLFHSNNY